LQVTFEEGTSAAWLYDLLKPHVMKLLVCDPRKNASMREGNQKDKIDARRLAELRRLNHLNPVYHGEHGLRSLKELVRSYLGITKDLGRVIMPRVKAIYRSRVPCTGKQVDAPRYRAEWLVKITEPRMRRRVEYYDQQLDALRTVRHGVQRDLLAEGKRGEQLHIPLDAIRLLPCKLSATSRGESKNMSLKTTAAMTIGSFLMLFTCASAFAAGDDACSLLTQSQVSSVLGVSAGVGQHPSDEMHLPPGDPAVDRRTCTWYEGGKISSVGKPVSLIILGTMGSLTPVQRFNNAKAPIQGITKTPITGVGDDAFFMVSQIRVTLHVKKGNSVFEIMVGGFPAEQIEQVKTMEKTLAQEVGAKL
jgi:hypothetical protein